MAEDSKSPPNPNPRASERPSVCEECGEKPWKYRCPGCSLVSCSLPCVQSHKRRISCDGKRRRTDFVPLRHFDDNLLLSDYNFLEETKRAAESAQRLIAGYGGYVGNNLPMRLRMLRNAAYRRKTQLFFLPLGMSKREKNRSIYNHRKNSIFWTLEWRFNSTDIILLDHGVDENAELSVSVEKHLSPSPWKDKLTQFRNVGLDDLKLFIRKSAKFIIALRPFKTFRCGPVAERQFGHEKRVGFKLLHMFELQGAKSPCRELNIRAPLGPQLKNVLAIEYPIIHVFLPSHSYDFEIEKDTNSFVERNETSDHVVVPKGSVFKEEEIEEGEMTSETQVLDIIDYKIPNYSGVNTSSGSNFGSQSKRLKENIEYGGRVKDPNLELNDASRLQNGSIFTHPRETNDAVRVFEYENFDFEQEMRDAYSDLLGEMNPDDFLCLDDGYCEEEGSKESKNALDFGGALFGAEELEEGEIPSF